MACGCTIGPISAAGLGLPTVDVGGPMLSMHRCREMAGSADVPVMVKVLTELFSTFTLGSTLCLKCPCPISLCQSIGGRPMSRP